MTKKNEGMLAREVDPHLAVDYIIKHSVDFAQAKADRVYMEEYRKSKKALLMKGAMMTKGNESVASQEREAYAHEDYRALLEHLKTAVFNEEKLRWELIGAQARVEIWRTQQANNRAEGKATL